MGSSHYITCTPLDEAFSQQFTLRSPVYDNHTARAPQRRVEGFQNAPAGYQNAPAPFHATEATRPLARRDMEALWREVEAHLHAKYL